MSVFQAFILGAVQGVTEFLPISSSAHLVLVPWLFGWKDPGLAFDVFIHLGTLLAVLGYFWRDWWVLLRAGLTSVIERKLGYERERLVFWLLVVGTIPAGLAGLVFHELAETAFRAPLLIAINLSVVGFLMYWIDGRYPSIRSTEEMEVKDAVWVGIAQAMAIVPGVSRSGATMTMARLLSFSREGAARFSFLLAVPITTAAVVFKLKDLVGLAQGGTLSWSYLAAGLVSSFVFGVVSIHILLQYLRTADFRVFAWYRLILGGGIIAWSLLAGR